MSNLAKISPEYDMYEAYSISSHDSEGQLHEPILRPSQIVDMDNQNYDSDSSDDDNNIIMSNVRKSPSVIDKSLRMFRLRANSLPTKVRDSLIGENKKSNFKKIIAGVSTFITGITLLFVFTF